MSDRTQGAEYLAPARQLLGYEPQQTWPDGVEAILAALDKP